ncbi:MAG TPA: glycosyltransferase family 4 protein [Vicinamibacterales bacterium]|nr:glycosyltransferase family 4 protein [Vicinamibacterales bacterium]
MKLAFVVQRYGADVAGGSESHCRELARHLSSRHDITVITTCARDYITWRNQYAPGESVDGAARVLRFPVARRRDLDRFAELSDEVFDGGAPRQVQEAWFRANGPDAPALLEYLARHGRDYDLVLFWTFRYAPSYFGVPLVRDRAVLVPTAEEDPAISLDVLEEFFRQPAGFLFMTPEEQALVCARAGRLLAPSAVVGTGLDPAAHEASGAEVLRRHGIDGEYALYLGRVDRNKGCDTLLEYFRVYAAARDAPTLVLAGPQAMQVPPHPRIRATGYVSEELREALLANARVLVVPSRYESLSIVLLEAWNHGVPALVNGRCRVLQGQVRRAGGGLYYRSAAEFVDALDWLLTRADLRDALGRQGRAYVDREYRWPTVVERVERLLAEVAARTSRRF